MERLPLKIVVASEGFEVSPHFAKCSNYSYYTVINGIITDYQNMPNTEHLCGAIAPLMKELGVNVVLTGGIGPKSLEALKSEDIAVVTGVSGDVRTAVESYVAGILETNTLTPKNKK